MITKKERVIREAYHLFIEKGVQATSIQDILDACGISKGTFYNYFSSKNELLMGVCRYLFGIIEQERNELLIGRDRSDVEIFIRQMELQMQENRTTKLLKLLDEMFHADDEEIRRFLRESQLRLIRWVYGRFLDLYGEHRKPVLLDCAIMFMGMLNYELRYNEQYNRYCDIGRIVRYCVRRIGRVVEEVAESGEQLMSPDIVDREDPPSERTELKRLIARLRSELEEAGLGGDHRLIELVEFAEEELLQTRPPRIRVLECALEALRADVPDRLGGLVDRLRAMVRQEAGRTARSRPRG